MANRALVRAPIGGARGDGRIYDAYGREAGDEALVEISSALT